MSPWGVLVSRHPEGSVEVDEDFATQALVKALKAKRGQAKSFRSQG
jgi:hypothetical protein